MKFIHTADWQIGKPFARIDDPRKRALVQQARFEAIKQIGVLVRDVKAEFVLVAGDLFDSASADKATVSAACSAIGQLMVPVIAIPGNHDHGGPGSVWGQDFFCREHETLAPNLTVLLEAEPVECGSAVILPCPLARRTGVGDPTEWLRSPDVYDRLPAGKPRIVLAHGSIQVFSSAWIDEEEGDSAAEVIYLERFPEDEVDYVALGDWHGTKQVGPKAWYSGTPEPDRFPRGEDHDAGSVLVVEAERGGTPEVSKVCTKTFGWWDLSFDLADDSAPTQLESRLVSLLGQRAGEDLLRLTLSGSLSIGAYNQLREILETVEARVLRLKLADSTVVAPTEEEIQALTEGGANPLIARVAGRLVEQAAGADEAAAVARVALRELHAVSTRKGAS